MATDDLDAPLGQETTTKRRRKLPITLPHVVIGGLGLFLLVFVGWIFLADNQLGGEPMTIVAADLRAPPKEPGAGSPPGTKPGAMAKAPATAPAPADAPRNDNAPPAIPPGAKTVTIIDGASGKRQEVVIPGTAPAPEKPAMTKAPSAPGGKLGAGIDQKMVETSRHGPIPKVGPDGQRAAEVYAQPVKPLADKPDAPRIAIVLTGLGISASSTTEALTQLPPPVTFAFMPYGDGLEQITGRARNQGHELLLEVPMEPYDYPDNDPGPQALLTTQSSEQNIDRLKWLMSRFPAYVGIGNFMGARFTASEQSIAPVLRETAKRGLIYFDDGSSPRSVASQIAGANNLPFAKAGVVIDAVPTPTDIGRALTRLEVQAREHGVAVGVAKALPVSIEQIAKWAKTAAERGYLLVPISAATTKAKSS